MKLLFFKSFLPAIFLIGSVLLCSCNVYFDSPQPSWVKKNEKEIPKKFCGSFLSGDGLLLEYSRGEKDTIRISEKRIHVSKQFDFTLSDTVLLKRYKNAYFLNVYYREVNTWMVIMAKEEKKNILFYVIYTTDSTKLTQLNEITDLRLMPESSKDVPNYIINPSSTEFDKIMKGNFFNVGDTLVRIR